MGNIIIFNECYTPNKSLDRKMETDWIQLKSSETHYFLDPNRESSDIQKALKT